MLQYSPYMDFENESMEKKKKVEKNKEVKGMQVIYSLDNCYQSPFLHF